MNEHERKTLREMFPDARQAFRLRNPEIFGAPVDPIQGAEREQAPEDALGTASQREPKGSRSMDKRLRFRVIFVSHRKKILDSDNLATGLKGLRDAIADWLGIDDSDTLIDWNYGQVQTRGEEGVAVRIEKL